MRRISFNQRFVNKAGNNLVPGKIHTIRGNYDFWKRFEGKEVELFTWEGKPYGKGSSHKVFCVKRIVSVQEVQLDDLEFWVKGPDHAGVIPTYFLLRKDGFANAKDFLDWFENYPNGKMAIIHFTDFRY